MKCKICHGKGYIVFGENAQDNIMCEYCRGSGQQLEIKFERGDRVKKVGGDYTYKGFIVSIIHKRSGQIRYVVEDDRGMLFIFNEKSLELLLK